jgi:hypothetical protein
MGMATRYQYRLFDAEFGPVGFRELVRLVRDGMLGADDLVKADWEQEWRPAAEVVGLFHMAGRADVLDLWEAERARCTQQVGDSDALDDVLNQAEVLSDEETPSWQRRWAQVQERQKILESDQAEELRERSEEAKAQQRFRDVISAAEAVIDRREAGRHPGRLRQWKDALLSSNSLHSMFRWGMTIVAAHLVAFGILTWSETEVQRYPKRGTPSTLQQQVFPFFGKCSSVEYLFLLADAMLVAGLGGYGGARVLESMADD